jgi:hypothetical protein
MAAPTTPRVSKIPSSHGLLPLENGDRLTRAEFERRYETMPHLKKAELIEGVVHVPSPVAGSVSPCQKRRVTFAM